MDGADLTDIETVPAIAMSQWRAGRVLSQDDVEMISKLLDEQSRIEAEATEAFHQGRMDAFYQIGGAQLVKAAQDGEAAVSEAMLKRAYAAFAAKVAELQSMKN